MTHHPRLDPAPTHPVPAAVPSAAWALALSSLLGQLAWLADAGVRPLDGGVAVSMLIGALLVAWVAHGVLTGRTVRLVIAWIVLVLVLLANAIELVTGGLDALLGWPALHFLTSVASVVSLAWFTRSDYFQWQHGRPQVAGPSLAPLVAVAVLVGMVGGVADTSQAVGGVELNVNL